MKSHSLFSCLPGPHSCLNLSSSCDAKNQCSPPHPQHRKQGQDHGDHEEEGHDSLPPSVEVFPSDVVNSKPFTTETINLQGGLVLLKGRVNSTEILGVGNSDLIPGKYEGGLKLWECAADLVNILQDEVKDGRLSFRGKRVLELGCGHGLPGIYACLKGASTVHFQDFNVEVLQSLTIRNVAANLDLASARQSQHQGDSGLNKMKQLAPDIHYYAGDWSKMEGFLSLFNPELLNEIGPDSHDGVCQVGGESLQDGSAESTVEKHNDSNMDRGLKKRHARKLSSSRACERAIDDVDASEGGYDIILMSETVYSIATLPKLYALVKKCLKPPYGVAYLAGKKHYFGVGGGTRAFKHVVEEDGLLGAHLVTEFADGSSNVREAWKFFFR